MEERREEGGRLLETIEEGRGRREEAAASPVPAAAAERSSEQDWVKRGSGTLAFHANSGRMGSETSDTYDGIRELLSELELNSEISFQAPPNAEIRARIRDSHTCIGVLVTIHFINTDRSLYASVKHSRIERVHKCVSEISCKN
jgi:hypothetical protein